MKLQEKVNELREIIKIKNKEIEKLKNKIREQEMDSLAYMAARKDIINEFS
jgi:peptidoglycan hydrolase CwlO-like protein